MKSMKKNIPYYCMRFLLFTINIALDLAGFLVLATGLGTILSREVGVFPPSTERIYLFPEILIVYGSVIAAIALIGTLAVAKESQPLLLTNMVLLLLLCAVELVAGTITYLKITPLTEKLKTDMQVGMNYYYESGEVKNAWDNMQRIVTCCGVTSQSDWDTVWANKSQYEQDIGSVSVDIKTHDCGGGQLVPISCKAADGTCYDDGCYNVAYQWVSDRIVPLGIGVMSLFMLQLLALLLAVILYGLKRLRHTKDEAHDTLLTQNHHPNTVDELDAY